MKKIIFTTLFCVISSISFSQSYYSEDADSVAEDIDDVCYQICGVNFGVSFDTAKALLRNKFGREQAYAENEELIFKNKSYAGITFDDLFFGFQSDGRRTYFNKCILFVYAKNAEDAKKKRDFLSQVVGNKYVLQTFIDSNKFKAYQGGTSPVNSNEYGFFIDVYHDREVWAVRLFYGPYQYVNEEF